MDNEFQLSSLVSEFRSALKIDVVETETVSFDGKSLKLDSAEDAKEVVDIINGSKDMKELILSGNTFGVGAAKALGECLKTQSQLTLAMFSDMFTGRLKAEVPAALCYISDGLMFAEVNLTVLDLSDNALGPNGLPGVIDLLKSPACYNLKVLKLNNDGLGITGGKMLAETLTFCYEAGSKVGRPLTLHEFVAGRNRLENQGAAALAQVFKKMGSLKVISMPQNGIHHAGIAALADAFSKNKDLSVIDLNDNTFTAKGTKHMSEAVSKLFNLTILNFNDCLIRTDGALKLAEALCEKHEKLHQLYLNNNEIALKGALAITQKIHSDLTGLRVVALNGNMFGENGIGQLLSLFEENGLSDIIGPLDEDEGSECSEDENEQSNNMSMTVSISDDEDEHVEDVVVTSSVISSQNALNILHFPSPKALNNLNEKDVDILVKTIKEESYVEKQVSHLVRLSTGLSSETDKSFNIILKVWKQVLGYIFQLSEAGKLNSDQKIEIGSDPSPGDSIDEADNVFAIMFQKLVLDPCDGNADKVNRYVGSLFVMYMGLLKTENQNIKTVSNPIGVVLLLKHIVQEEFFPRQTILDLRTFIEKPNERIWNPCMNERNELLRIMFKF